MKLALPILLLLFGCSKNTCLWHNQEASEESSSLSSATRKVIKIQREAIYMGGVSSQSKAEFTAKESHFLRIDTRAPRVRASKASYDKFEASLLLDANSDTGDDRLRIFAGDSLIYSTLFHDGEQRVRLKFYLHRESKLRFVVDNPETLNNTPGAFAATIKLKMN